MHEHAGFAQMPLSYKVAADTRVDLPDVDAESGTPAYAHLDVKISWTTDNGDDDVEGPFSLEASVTGEFALDEAHVVDLVALERWLELNATHLLWTYARAYLSTVTGFSRHPPLTLFTIAVSGSRASNPDTGEHDALGVSQSRPTG